MARIGKLIGGALYVHRQYQHEIPAAVLTAARSLSGGFPYDVVKWDTQTNNVTFVQCLDFDTAPEPSVGLSLLVRPDGTTKLMRPAADPWVYHHKYQFVGSDYRGFSVEAARRRQRAIDALPGVDKKRIGKASVNARMTASLGAVEKNNVAATSVKQTPALFHFPDWQPYTRNADVGGGKFELGTDLLRTYHVQNLVYDPYSRPDTYQHVGSLLHHHPADTGTLANVLNVIEEAENRHAVLRDLARFVKPGGTVYIGIYEASRSGVGARTKTGSWQNNLPTKSYLPEVQAVFGDARIVKGFIVATSPGPVGLSGLEQFNPNRMATYKSLQRRGGKIPKASDYFGVLTREYEDYSPSYLTKGGDLNISQLADWLEDNYDESLLIDAAEVVFEWAEATRPAGYETLAEIISTPAVPLFAVGDEVTSYVGNGVISSVKIAPGTGSQRDYLYRLELLVDERLNTDFVGGSQRKNGQGKRAWVTEGWLTKVAAPVPDRARALRLAKAKVLVLLALQAQAKKRL